MNNSRKNVHFIAINILTDFLFFFKVTTKFYFWSLRFYRVISLELLAKIKKKNGLLESKRSQRDRSDPLFKREKKQTISQQNHILDK